MNQTRDQQRHRLPLLLTRLRPAQGFSIDEIGKQLTSLPKKRAPTQRDWTRISRQFRQELDERIEALTNLRDRLDGCIGCGCLSLKKCSIYNPEDRAASKGPGPRYLLGDKPGASR